jgi:hypothetical protein
MVYSAEKAIRPPNECPTKTRYGAVRYVASMRGINSFFMNERKFGPPPVILSVVSGLPSKPAVTCVGDRSRIRLVLGMATTIISGTTKVPLTPVPRICRRPVTEWKCASPSSR